MVDPAGDGWVPYDDDCLIVTLDDVAANTELLLRHGKYEKALLSAFVRTNHADWPPFALRALFEQADRTRLRAAGDPLPGDGPFTVYRGVAGPEPERRVLGLSWTSSIEQACWFAEQHALRFSTDADPGVYRISVISQQVLAYVNREDEQEFILIPRADIERPERVE